PLNPTPNILQQRRARGVAPCRAAVVAAASACATSALAQVPQHYTATPLPPNYVIPIQPADGSNPDLDWNTTHNGAGPLSAGSLLPGGTAGQPDAGRLTNGSLELVGGYWSLDTVVPCYANCDGSTQAPVLNILDFTCFLQKFAAGDPYANCDGSTQAPTLNV